MNNLEIVGIPYFKKGNGIHIKKKNRGKFTEYCDGKVTQECINKAKHSGNTKLIKRAVFAENARAWKRQQGGYLIPKYQNPAQRIKRIDLNGLRKDPRFKKFNWYMNDINLNIIQDSLIARKADFPEQVAVFSQVIPESGGDTKPHGNGAFGQLGWRGPRKENLPEDAPGQTHKIMSEIYDNPTAKDWTHGGKGTGVKTGRDMRRLFLDTPNVIQATKAFMKGYVRPESKEWNRRLEFAELLKKYWK